jgi:hypothetical protein
LEADHDFAGLPVIPSLPDSALASRNSPARIRLPMCRQPLDRLSRRFLTHKFVDFFCDDAFPDKFLLVPKVTD